MRQIEKGTRGQRYPNGINHTTVHHAFTDPRLARWEVVAAIVRCLGGDVDEFVPLWRAAREAQASLRNAGNEPEPPSHVEQQDAPVQAGPQLPRQLPPDVFGFTGRTDVLATMERLIEDAGNGPAAMVISALSGTAGVGKTALAVHWAHRVADRFPDGQLYVDMRGYGPDEPLTPARALAGFLRALGVNGRDIPYELAERAAHYRTLMSDRRMLVVLDNASSVEQVRPLLPAARCSLVMITSRDSLPGLVARDGARRIDLDLLEPGEAVELLRTLIGPRAQAEPVAVERLAALCTRLPLALRIAAELAASRPGVALGELADELADERTRLDLLDAGADARSSVSSVFSWSYRALRDLDAKLFRLLGLNPAAEVDSYGAAALAGTDLAQAKASLDRLARAHLIQRCLTGRFSMHDLLRTYAARLADQAETEGSRRAAVLRLLDYYLATTAKAMDAAFPAEQKRRPRPFALTTPSPEFASAAEGRAWLDDQRGDLVTVVGYAAQHGCAVHAVKIADVLWRHLHNGAFHQEALMIHGAALAASSQMADRRYDGIARVNLGTVHWRLGQHDEAASNYQEALTAFRAAGDRTGEARVLANLGAVYWLWGNYDDAAEYSLLAFTAFGDMGDLAGESRALGNLGAIRAGQGRYEEAARCHRHSLQIAREIGDRQAEGRALDNLGVVLARQGHLDTAAEHHTRALTISRELGDRTGEAGALENLGLLHRDDGRFEQALEDFEMVLGIACDIGNRNREASVLNAVGETFRATGQIEQAQSHHELALAKANEIGNRYERARALNGLGHTMNATGNLRNARSHWQDALAIYEDIGAPEAVAVASSLHALEVVNPGDPIRAHGNGRPKRNRPTEPGSGIVSP
jgi:tetratricopeptide (TPR) repeat protein